FVQELVDLVQARHQEKPKIFVEWSESIIADVLNCVLHSSFLANIHASPQVSGIENHSWSKSSFGSKSVSIQSAIPNTKCAIFDDNSVREVHPHGPNLPSLVTPVIPVVDGGIHNPVVLAGSTTPKLCDEVVVNQAAAPNCPVLSEDKSRVSTPVHSISAKEKSFPLFVVGVVQGSCWEGPAGGFIVLFVYLTTGSDFHSPTRFVGKSSFIFVGCFVQIQMSSGQWSENLTDIHWKSIK
uniref:Uncharacterized protein n=1 Tax=Aegilops tauschii subsp. strangulata TaxID=200361 RepID=A0A453SPE3_AEGTS